MTNKRASTREEKVAWLRSRPDLWDRNLSAIKHAMVDAGLCSTKTYLPDLRINKILETLKVENQKA